MTELLAGLPTEIDGYDLDAERARYALIPDVTVHGASLNRGTARIELQSAIETPELARVREEHLKDIFTTTHGASSPVVELGYPTAGSYVACSAGVYLDCQLGVAQKIIDENHPLYQKALAGLAQSGLMLRREIDTDDFLTHGPGTRGEIHTPQELAARFAGLAHEAFPIVDGGYKVFFSNSGAEAVEAGIKLAMRVRYRQLVERYGLDVLGRLMAGLGIARNELLEGYDRANDEPLYREYPFFVFGFEGAFHGRTLGALCLTQSRRVHQLGFSKGRWYRHVRWNHGAEEMREILDGRPLPEILDAPGGVRAVLDAGRVPKDLAAAFVAEPFQGEGGYRVGDRAAFRALGGVLEENGVLFMLDEVQTFGRTGRVFCASYFLNHPDIVTVAKGAFLGATIARRDLERYLQPGWHSNTWGGGKMFDNQIAYAVLEALTAYRDPVLDGMTYVENCRVKGAYLTAMLDRIQALCPEMLVEHAGLGLMHGVSVRFPKAVIATAWQRGLKLLGCGPTGDPGRIRLLFLADCLAKEIDDFGEAFLATLRAVQAAKLEGAAA